MDAELREIRRYQGTLRQSRAARLDEILSLRSRYPEIVLPEAATVEQIYKALYNVRMSRAAKIKPLWQQKQSYLDKEVCRASRNFKKMIADIESGDGYKSLPLKERLEWRADIDEINAGTDCKEVTK